MIHGTHQEQFGKLMDYNAELERTNPCLTVQIEFDVLSFQRIYICRDALKRGSKSCRQFIEVDGCFLKSLQGWQRLSAVGIDAMMAFILWHGLSWRMRASAPKNGSLTFLKLIYKSQTHPDGLLCLTNRR
ncbi:hypothetical protein LINGRAHAP2_LOCUS27742 [Linum grandiflorum]